MRFNRLSLILVFSFFFHALAWGQVSEVGTHPDAKEWYKKTQKLKAIESRIKEQNKKLQILIKQKNNGLKVILGEKGERFDILEAIVSTHRELEDSHDDYNRERREIKYRYPGGADLVERRYLPLRAPTLQQLEREMGLDGDLTVLKNKIDKKYSSIVKRPPDAPARDDGPESTLRKTRKQEKREKLKIVK